MSDRCGCEDIRHEYEDGASCPGGPRGLGARADHVGAICDECARGCLRDYLIEVGGLSVSEPRWHQTRRHPAAYLVASDGEILADFYGPDRMTHARLFALARATQPSQAS